MTVLDKTSQALDAVLWAPSDTLNVADANNRQRITDGIGLAVAGNLRVTMAGVSEQGGADVVLTGLAAGVIHPIRASKVWATNTTATGVTCYFT